MSEAKANARLALPGLPRGTGDIPEDWWQPDVTPESYAVTFPLHFMGPPSHTVQGEVDVGTFQAVASLSAVGLAYLSPEFFKGKIVLLGTGIRASSRTTEWWP